MATGAAQEMLGNIPCDICNTYKDVIWRCQSCPETMCNQCKIHHLNSRATKNHEVTELANVTEENQSSSVFCPNHESEAFQMYCTTCDSLVCLRCITEIHKLHEYKMMEDIAKETKTQLENVFEQIKTNQIPKLEMSAVAITEIQENYSQDKKKLLKSITTRGKDIKLAINQIINKLRDESVQQATADETCLKETKEKIHLELAILKKQLNEEEQRVKRLSDVDMIVKATGIKDSLTQLTKRSSEIHVQPIQPLKFQIGHYNDNDLKKMVRQLMFELNIRTEECKHDQAGEKQSKEDPNVSTGKSTASKQNQSPVDSSNKSETSMRPKLSESTEGGPCGNEKATIPKIRKNCVDSLEKFPEKPPTDQSKVQDSRIIKGNIVSLFKWKTNIRRLKLLNHNEAWLFTGSEFLGESNQYLELVNDQGKQIKSLRPDFTIWDMDKTTGSDLLVTELLGHHIKRISKSGDIDTFADLSPYETWGIHVTKNGDVLVGLNLVGDGNYNRVTRLSSQGQTLQVIVKTAIDFGRPRRITENVYQDIVMICDWRYIIVVDRNGKFRFKYTGLNQMKMTRKFRPRDIICNQNGQILVADAYNNTIHLLDKDGNFIQFILDHPPILKSPTALAIDGTNRLWVGCNDGQVFLVELF